MAFKSVFVTTLFFADLTVPSKTLEAFGLLLVGDGFGCSGFCSWHGVGIVEEGDEAAELTGRSGFYVNIRWLASKSRRVITSIYPQW